MERTTKCSQSVLHDDEYEETVTDTEITRRRSSSVTYHGEKSCVERDQRSPDGSEIDRGAARIPPKPALPPIQLPRRRSGTEKTNAMHDLLVDPLIRVHLSEGEVERLSLPEVFAALAADRISAFPALRPHQRHAWHAFLCQLGVIALHRAGLPEAAKSADEWRSLLRAATPEFADDQPWHLVVDDPAQPAFMQPPSPLGLAEYRGWKETPDDLDILVSAKNHEIKQTTATHADLDDWLFALVDLQTMGGYLGAGNYPIARMNGGYSSRPCVGLAPADGGLGAHLGFDMRRMLDGREALLHSYDRYFRPADGIALTWMEPWDGTDSLDLRELDPYFIEVCRRVRLVSHKGRLAARTAASKAPRISAKEAGGNVGDFWTPVRVQDGKALSLSPVGFRYDRLSDLVFGSSYGRPVAMYVQAEEGKRWRLVARGVAAGQGKTEGYYERTEIDLSTATVNSLRRKNESGRLAAIAQEQIAEVEDVTKALRFGIAVAAGGGRDANELTKAHRSHAGPYARRLDAVADALFFPALEDRYTAARAGEVALRQAYRARFATRLIHAAKELLHEAVETVPCPAIRRPRARARAVTAFWGRLRKGVFSDQPEVFATQEVSSAE